MRYLSLCSGVEAASLAWRWIGWEPVAFSEIEPFPCAVLKERFPNVPNLGDITRIEVTDEEIRGNGFAIRRGSVDLIVGGTPCQSFSVAGKRAGLEGASGLAYHFVRLLQEIQPKWFVWENVPGALSSRTNGQNDFNFLVNEYAKCGYGVAWRILDAQYVRTQHYPYAIPQRRRRVFVVGRLGDDGTSAAKVLLVGEGLRGNPAPRRESRKTASGNPAGGLDDAGGMSFQERAGKPGGGKGILIQGGHVGAMGTQNVQSVLSFSSNMGSTATTVDKDVTHPLCATGNQIGVMGQKGCDIYNLKVTGDVAPTCSASIGGSNGSGAKVLSPKVDDVISIQTSHTKGNGCGISPEKGTFYTMGHADINAVAVPVAMRGNRKADGSDAGKLPETDMGGASYTVTQVQTDSMVATGMDGHNAQVTGDVAMTITNGRADPQHLPSVINTPPVCSLNFDNYSGEQVEISPTLGHNHGGETMVYKGSKECAKETESGTSATGEES